jgi:hypothetical protein
MGLYGDERGPREFDVRQKHDKPFDLQHPIGRRRALRYLYMHLPFEVFAVIFKIMIGMSTEVVHPISGQLVSRMQMTLNRTIFWGMFIYGPSAGQRMLWGKNFPADIRERFCSRCGEPQLALVWSGAQNLCVTNNTKCRHPRGNYRCHRAIQMMGGYCHHCIQDVNVPYQRF